MDDHDRDRDHRRIPKGIPLSAEEERIIDAAADAAGVSRAAFVRSAAIERATLGGAPLDPEASRILAQLAHSMGVRVQDLAAQVLAIAVGQLGGQR